MRFIVIIPTFNEAENLPDCLESIREATLPLPTSADVAAASTESVTVVVSDGGSSDGTVDIARERGASIVSKAPMPHVGRGAQLSHAIASVTTPPDAFLFLHADCRLQRGAFSALAEAFRGGACRAEDTCKRPRPRVGVVTMRIRFRVPKSASARQRWLLNRAEAWCNEEKGGLYRSFGDAAIAATPAALDALNGGLKPWPLFEDVDFFRRARWCERKQRRLAVRKLPVRAGEAAVVLASPRRFEQDGYARYAAKCWCLITLFNWGVDAQKLNRMYAPGKNGRSRQKKTQQQQQQQQQQQHLEQMTMKPYSSTGGSRRAIRRGRAVGEVLPVATGAVARDRPFGFVGAAGGGIGGGGTSDGGCLCGCGGLVYE